MTAVESRGNIGMNYSTSHVKGLVFITLRTAYAQVTPISQRLSFQTALNTISDYFFLILALYDGEGEEIPLM